MPILQTITIWVEHYTTLFNMHGHFNTNTHGVFQAMMNSILAKMIDFYLPKRRPRENGERVMGWAATRSVSIPRPLKTKTVASSNTFNSNISRIYVLLSY